MITRKPKVVPPVTPRIVSAQPGQRLLRYALVCCALLITGWLAYQLGRAQAPADADVAVTQPGQPDERLSALEQERDALKQQIAQLQHDLEQERRTFEAERDHMRALQRAESAPREAPAPALEPEPEPASFTQATVEPVLRLEDVRITETESDSLFRITFLVTHDGDSSDRVTGTIWIAVNGTTNGKPTRLSLKALSPERRSFVTMGFKQRQEVAEDVVLPEDFLPRNILIEAKPYGDKYTGSSESVAWLTSG